jgi:hypothetical protein
MLKKKIIISLTLSVLIFGLAACGGSVSTGSSTASTDTSGASIFEGITLNDTSILAIGLIGMDGTNNAVTAEQVATLIPLWQAYQALAFNDTTAQQELDAVVNQIRNTLTDAQLQAIQDLDITSDNFQTYLGDFGMNNMARPSMSGIPEVSAIDPSQMGSNTSGQGGPGGEMPGGGQMPSGGPSFSGGSGPGAGGRPGDGGGAFIVSGDARGDMSAMGDAFAAGATPDPSTLATMEAAASNQIQTTFILNAVIRYLQQIGG